VLLCMGRDLSVPPVKDTKDTGSDLVADDGFLVFADNVVGPKASDSRPSRLSHSSLMNALLELATSLM